MKSNLPPLTEASSLGLDLVRALAAQLVVVGHGLVFFGIADIPWLQNSAVLVFFLLSGFIITYSTLRKKDSRIYEFKDYFVERFARIYVGLVPALLFILFVDTAVLRAIPEIYTYTDAFDTKTFLGNLLMLQDHPVLSSMANRLDAPILDVTSFGSGRPLWTVGVEWWLYLLFGWLVLPSRSKKSKVAILPSFMILAIIPAYNLMDGRGHGLTLVWMLGVAIVFLNARLANTVPKRYSALAALTFMAFAVGKLYLTRVAYDPHLALLLAGAMLFALLYLQATESVPKYVPTRSIRFGALFSYSLYLVHYSILVALSHWNPSYSGWMLLALGIVLSNVVAIAFALLFERRYRGVAKWIQRRVNPSLPNS